MTAAAPASPRNGRRRTALADGRGLARLAAAPVLLSAVLGLVTYLVNPGVAFEPTWLLPPLSLVFQTGLPLVVAGLAVSSYRTTGVGAVLAIGAGMLAYAAAGGILSFVFLELAGPNAQVAVHNMAVLISGVCYFIATPIVLLSSPRRASGARGRQAALVYAVVIAAVLATGTLIATGAMPRFISIVGDFTPLRGAVLGLAIGLYSIAAGIWWESYLRTRLEFSRWYALGLMLYAIGFVGVFAEHAPGDLLSWVGRTAQFLAAPYFLVAVWMASRERGFAVSLVESSLPYRPLLESISEAVVALDPQGGIMYWNQAAKHLLGYESGEVFGADLFDIAVPKEQLQEARRLIADAPSGGSPGSARLELTLADREGRRFPAELTFYSNPAFPSAQNVWVIRDVTEAKRAEAELRQSRDHLEELVVARTAELAAANQELEGFSYAMSHVMAAPLRAIDGFAHLLLDDYADKLDAEGQRRLKLIRAGAAELNVLIEDVLEFLRLGRRPVSPQKLEMGPIVTDVLEALKPAAGLRRLDIQVGALPDGLADPELIREVWRSLIDNAIKFTAPKADARIEIGGAEGPKEVAYFVRDNGVGFDMRFAEKMWRVFERLHGVEFAGNGMGLPVVRRIVLKHGGRVWAEGEVDEGATVWFALPKTPPPSSRGAAQAG